MDVFNALWDNPEQRRRPPDDNFQLFTVEEWFASSSTHKILTGSLQCPLPSEIEPKGNRFQKNYSNNNIRDLLMQKSQSEKAAQQDSSKEKLYVPGYTKFPQFNRISSLTAQEHADCLRLMLKYDGKAMEDLSSTEKAEYQLFQSLYSRVQEEQKIYLECAREIWPEFKNRTNTLRGDPHNYFLQYWTNKVTNAMSQYPHKYKKLRSISLHLKCEMRPTLYFLKNILNIGKIPLCRLPEFHQPFRVASSLLKLKVSSLLNIPSSHLNGTLHKVPVSRDPNAERLARLHNANVVISTSGIRCLLDIHDEKKYPPLSGVGKSWVLPIVVKEHRSFCNGKPVTKTTVFIDKQLPKAKMTGFEKVSWYQKRALFAAVINRSHSGGIVFDIEGDDIFIRKAPDSRAMTSENLSNTKPKESAPKSNVPEKNISNTTKTSTSDNNDDDDDDEEDDEDALTIDLPENDIVKSEQPGGTAMESNDSNIKGQTSTSQDTPVTLEADTQSTTSSDGQAQLIELSHTAKSEESVSTIDLKNKIPVSKIECSGESNEKAPLESAANKWEKLSPPEPVKIVAGNALPVSTTNLTYNLWCLKSEPSDPNQPDRDGEINLLIRSQVDGCEDLGTGKYQTVCLATKPDFQLEYGPGIVPLSDLTRQWAKLLIQPETSLARIRVNVKSSELVKIEKRSMLEIEEETQVLYQTALPDTLQHLQHILTELTQLPTGKYLLSHSSQMGTNAELFKEANEADAIDWYLPRDYGLQPEIIDCDMPWPKIDTNVILPKHLQIQSMPCTFHCPKGPTLLSKPSKPQEMKKQQPRLGTAGNMKKKKKNKKSKAKKAPVKAAEPEGEGGSDKE